MILSLSSVFSLVNLNNDSTAASGLKVSKLIGGGNLPDYRIKRYTEQGFLKFIPLPIQLILKLQLYEYRLHEHLELSYNNFFFYCRRSLIWKEILHTWWYIDIYCILHEWMILIVLFNWMITVVTRDDSINVYQILQ